MKKLIVLLTIFLIFSSNSMDEVYDEMNELEEQQINIEEDAYLKNVKIDVKLKFEYQELNKIIVRKEIRRCLSNFCFFIAAFGTYILWNKYLNS